MNKPIKRHQCLQPLSREHHQGLLLCWKIRTGFKKGVEIARMKRYSDWFFDTQIKPHFAVEESLLFPILGNDHELVKTALSQHQQLTRLFQDSIEVEKSLGLIEKQLDQHIRFEERVLFNEIQQVANAEQLASFDEQHTESAFEENTKDQFWL